MKRLLLFAIGLGLCAMTLSCRRSGEEVNTISYEPGISTDSATEVTDWSATISGYAYLPDAFSSDNTERGIIISDESEIDLNNGSVYTITGNNPDISVIVSGLSPETTYYYRTFIKDGENVEYGPVKSFTTTAIDEKTKAHPYVDLGLSVRWATCNLGGQVETDYGEYYAWGDVPEKKKDDFSWQTYPWYNATDKKLSKYCTKENCGPFDGLSNLESSDDPATAAWGGNWRTPTEAEIQELLTKCTVTSTMKVVNIEGTVVEVNGILITNKKTKANIFLPAGGFKQGKSVSGEKVACNYWSSTLSTGNPYYARYLCTNLGSSYVAGNNRFLGLCIRPVTK